MHDDVITGLIESRIRSRIPFSMVTSGGRLPKVKETLDLAAALRREQPKTKALPLLLGVESKGTTMDDLEHTDDDVLEAVERAEDDVDEQVRNYCDSISAEGIGNGWFDTNLSTFHERVGMPERRTFYSSPRSLEEIERPVETPENHPLRAIAWMMNDAPPQSTIRVYAYVLTDLPAIDLLVHHGSTKIVKVISQDSRKTRERLNEFFDLYGRVGKRAFLENVQVRLANLTGTPCASRNVQMHDKSIITQRYTSFGSYNLSAFGRVGNWESLTVVNTEPLHVERFDEMWASLDGREIERFYREMDSPNRGPKRQRR